MYDCDPHCISLGVPERIQGLRDELFATPDSTCPARAEIVTESYRQTEGEPKVIRRAKAIYAVFERMPVWIREGEMLVGQRAARLGARSVYPEYNLDGLSREDAPAGVWDYWSGRTIGDEVRRGHPERLRLAESEAACGGVTGTATGYGHVIVDYPLVLREGFRAIAHRARTLLEAAPEEDLESRQFLRAAVVSCEGIMLWARRHAEAAENAAEAQADPRRATELRTIAAVCRRVPAEPARTFHEALQSFWFTHLAMHMEQYGWSISAGRLDQFAAPLLAADLDAGRLDRSGAWELLLGLWVKFMENIGTRIKATTFQNLTLGGQDLRGRDQSNLLSHMCLDATLALRFNQPALSVRYHKNIAPDFWDHVCRTIGAGLGMPALFNDDVVIAGLIRNGVTRDDAIGYGIVGCVEAAVPGKMQGVTAGGHINVAKAFELALNEGRSMLSGRQLGPPTAPPEDFVGFEDLWRAYAEQVEYLAGLNLLASVQAAEAQRRSGHCPLMSCLLDDCLTRGRDLVAGGTRYNLPGVCIYGPTNVYDGLSAIRKLILREGKLDWAQLHRALLDDFKGHEPVRRMLATAAPRFGNDEPDVDDLANRVNAIHAEFCWKHVDPRNGRFPCGVWPVEGHVHAGRLTAATPDGRRSGEPLVDGVGACQGADHHGPTALLSSVARLDHVNHWSAGNTCNIKLHPGMFATRAGRARVKALFEGYMSLGGQQLQVNVVDAARLRAAREQPEAHADLVVRVAGFSAYFTQLGRATQDEILCRVEHTV